MSGGYTPGHVSSGDEKSEPSGCYRDGRSIVVDCLLQQYIQVRVRQRVPVRVLLLRSRTDQVLQLNLVSMVATSSWN